MVEKCCWHGWGMMLNAEPNPGPECTLARSPMAGELMDLDDFVPHGFEGKRP